MTEFTANSPTVPYPGDPDRKRALNVLAQRRYRQRRREKMQSLESKLRSRTVIAVSPIPTPLSSTEVVGTRISPWKCQDNPVPFQVEFHGSCSYDASQSLPLDLDSFISVETFATPIPQHTTSCSSTMNNLPQTPSPNDIIQNNQAPFTPIAAELQSLETSQFTFPDDNNLCVPTLASMKAGLTIAAALGCAQALWDISTLRTFTESQIPPSSSNFAIPPNLLPTPAQQSIPHLAIFDIIPWPTVRTRIICVFAQPAHLRPVGAREEDSVLKFMWDLEADNEGVRVSGSDCYDENNWEVGQTVFENWWWAFDRGVWENSNMLRRRRGVGRLVLPRVAAA